MSSWQNKTDQHNNSIIASLGTTVISESFFILIYKICVGKLVLSVYSWGGSGDRKHVKLVTRKEVPLIHTVLNPVLSHLVSRLGTVFY